MSRTQFARIRRPRPAVATAARAVVEVMERRQLLSVTPVILLAGDNTALSSGTPITNWPVGVPLQLEALHNVDAYGNPSDGTTFGTGQNPNNTLFTWNFGDTAEASSADYTSGLRDPKQVLTGFNAAHVYDAPGTYTVTLSTVDASGGTASTTVTVGVTATAGNTASAPVVTSGVSTTRPAPTSFGSSASNLNTTPGNVLYVDDNSATISAEGGATVAGTSPTVVTSGGVVVNGPLTSYAQAYNVLYTNSSFHSGVQVRFRSGDTFTISAASSTLTNTDVLIGSYDPTNPSSPISAPAILQGSGAPTANSATYGGFSLGSAAAYWSFQDIKFASLSTAIAADLSVGLSVRNCTFSEVNDDVNMDNVPDTGNLIQGTLIQDCTDQTPAADRGSYIFFIQGQASVIVDNTFTGGENATSAQPYLRFDTGYNLATDILVEGNTVNDQYGYKDVDLTIRGEADFVYVAGNTFEGGDVVLTGNTSELHVDQGSNSTQPFSSEPQDTFGSYVNGSGQTVYTVYGPTYKNQGQADMNWVVADSNRVLGGDLSGSADTDHMTARNNVVERYANEPTQNNGDGQTDYVFNGTTIVGAVGSTTHLAVQDLQLIDNTAYNEVTSGYTPAYQLNSSTPLSNAVFTNNLYVDPDATSTAYPSYEASLDSGSTYTSFTGNVWLDPSGTGSATKFFIGDMNTTWTLATLNSHFSGSGTAVAGVTIGADPSYSTTGGTLAVTAGTLPSDSLYGAARYDFYGQLRPSTGVVAGAVQSVPASLPTAPSNLAALADDEGDVNLTWTDNSSNETGFKVLRSIDGAPYALVYTTAANAQSYTDTGRTPGYAYSYEVEATNSAGDSAPTSASSALVPLIISQVTGTSGSYSNLGNTIAKVDDGNFGTFFDGPDASGDWVGLDLGSSQTITAIAYSPRSTYASRMVGGYFQGSNSLTGTAVTLATISSAPAYGTLTVIHLSSPVTYRYISYVGPSNGYCNITELQAYGAVQLTGTVSAAAGTGNLNGNAVTNATDGDLTSFYDSNYASNQYVQIDLGAARSVTSIGYAPRSGFASRMTGGYFEASNASDFSSGVVTAYTISSAPTVGVLTTVSVSPGAAYRYWRYVAPTNSYGNIAEFQLFGY